MGIKDLYSFHPISTAQGVKTRKAIRMPFKMGFMFKSIVAIKKPTITHIKNAEIFASQVNFLMIIGITSITPAAIPGIIPIMIVFRFGFLCGYYHCAGMFYMTHNGPAIWGGCVGLRIEAVTTKASLRQGTGTQP